MSSAVTIKSGATPATIWKTVDGLFARLARVIEVTLGVVFIFAVLLNFITAADRFLFKRSIIGSDEVQIYIMIWMTFIGAAVVTWRHRHLRMDVLVSRLPHKARLVLLGLELLLVLVLMVIMTSESLKYAMLMYAIDRRSDLGDIPMWIPHSGLAIGFGLIGLMTAWRIVGLMASRSEPEDHVSDLRI